MSTRGTRTRSATVCFFFFKQKTAYEIDMDWSSDVCSSDLAPGGAVAAEGRGGNGRHAAADRDIGRAVDDRPDVPDARSEERRVGKECRSRGAAKLSKKKNKNNTKFNTTNKFK